MGQDLEQGLSNTNVPVAKRQRTCIKCRILSITPDVLIRTGWLSFSSLASTPRLLMKVSTTSHSEKQWFGDKGEGRWQVEIKDGEGAGSSEKIRKNFESTLRTLAIMLKVMKTLKGFKRVSEMIIFELQKDHFVAEWEMDWMKLKTARRKLLP